MKSKNEPTKYTVNQLNKMIDKGIPVWILDNYYGWISVDAWSWVDKKEYRDAESYYHADGTWCGLVAESGGYHFPYSCIQKIVIGQEIEIK